MFSDIASKWIDGDFITADGIVPSGSPDRSLTRCVLKDKDTGQQFVLEGIGLDKAQKRRRQAQTLWELKQNGCGKILPWLPLSDGQWGTEEDNLFWQMRHYVPSNPLNRETYGQEAWRGEAMASLLVDMQRASSALTFHFPDFSIVDYVRGLLPRIHEKNEALYHDLIPIWEELDEFSQAERSLPMVFAHGDFHPLNVLWGDNGLTGVIDWEFAGPKPQGYDAANLLGCLGMDSPEFLTGPMAMAFVHRLGMDCRWLPEYIAALRFAWMREWCWRKDKEMMIQELDFLWLVLDNRELLRKRWCSPA